MPKIGCKAKEEAVCGRLSKRTWKKITAKSVSWFIKCEAIGPEYKKAKKTFYEKGEIREEREVSTTKQKPAAYYDVAFPNGYIASIYTDAEYPCWNLRLDIGTPDGMTEHWFSSKTKELLHLDSIYPEGDQLTYREDDVLTFCQRVANLPPRDLERDQKRRELRKMLDRLELEFFEYDRAYRGENESAIVCNEIYYFDETTHEYREIEMEYTDLFIALRSSLDP